MAATTFPKSTFPPGHTAEDFQCFGPPAIKDGEFDNARIADMGCFSQEEKDSNKYYHVAVIHSRQTQQWGNYKEWGRVGATKPQFQVVMYDSEQEAIAEFVKQCHEKNDKRGVWTTIQAGDKSIKTLTCKPGKDVYVVKALATRAIGLPDAKTIVFNDGSPAKPAAKKAAVSNSKIDNQTSSLLDALIGGVIIWAKKNTADSSIPIQSTIDDSWSLLTEAQKLFVVIGDNIEDQIRDPKLLMISKELYSRLGRKKALKAVPKEWVVNAGNIVSWQNDLDAFAAALHGQQNLGNEDADPFRGLPLHMEWIDPKSEVGKFVYTWLPTSSGNKHPIPPMKIKNVWRVDRNEEGNRFSEAQKKIGQAMLGKKPCETPLFQPKDRTDISNKEVYQTSHTVMLLHGSRSVNVSGLLRTGFRKPKELVGVKLTSQMFGQGFYFTEDWRKSHGYTSAPGSYWAKGDGGVSGRGAFMFGSDVVLGQPYFAPSGNNYETYPAGTHSVFGMGKNYGKRDAHGNVVCTKSHHGGLENNEWFVSQENQIRFRYLIEFTN